MSLSPAKIPALLPSTLLITAALLMSTALRAEVYVLDYDRETTLSKQNERALRAQSQYLDRVFGSSSNEITRRQFDSGSLHGHLDSLTSEVISEPFRVLLRFNSHIVGLEKEDLISNNAVIEAIDGSGTLFSLRVVPDPYSVGDINVQLRELSVTDIVGNLNEDPSNILLRSSPISLDTASFIAESRVGDRTVDYQPIRVQPREVNPNEFGFRVLSSRQSATR